MLALELADGCVQCVTEEAIQGAGIIAAGSKDRLHHRDIRADMDLSIMRGGQVVLTSSVSFASARHVECSFTPLLVLSEEDPLPLGSSSVFSHSSASSSFA